MSAFLLKMSITFSITSLRNFGVVLVSARTRSCHVSPPDAQSIARLQGRILLSRALGWLYS